jgi:hypothetical protein
MPTLQVFDPPMCCSTGVCGPAVDPKLAEFAADLDWVRRQGIEVHRFSLSQRPDAFARDAEIVKLASDGGLPAFALDGRIVHTGGYPTRGQMARWVGLALHPVSTTRAATKLEECRAALSSGRLLLICIRSAGAATALHGVREYLASPELAPSTMVEFEPGDAEGESLLREIGAEVLPGATIVLVLAPPGRILGQFRGAPTKQEIALAVTRSCSPGSSCCG